MEEQECPGRHKTNITPDKNPNAVYEAGVKLQHRLSEDLYNVQKEGCANNILVFLPYQ